jgi:hypothetical protein
VELAREASTALVVSALAQAGGTVTSLNPLHTTLEEIFVRQVERTGSARAEAFE